MNEAELFFSEILNCSRQDLYLNKNILLGKDKSTLIAAALKRRISGEPIEYILGSSEFMGLKFKVSADVLIPRPETEILVEKTIELATALYESLPQSASASKLSNLVPACHCERSEAIFLTPKRLLRPFGARNDTSVKPVINILDVGTGSGCIAISLAKYLARAEITAMDISELSLKVAQENAALNDVKVDFIHGDFFATYDLRPTTYDLIVSNPPYIASADIATLQPEVLSQPLLALDGGKDGLGFYRRMAKVAPVYLKPGGLLIMEMGFRQRQAIERILLGAGILSILEVIKDYRDIERVLVAKRAS
ncbi:MAG: HemK/PrmC family methyltransferase [Candidatus Omnitrophota bacterium]